MLQTILDFPADDITAWLLDPKEYQLELDRIISAQKQADDDLIIELLKN
jgi:hypothetical protein